jgi:outer membrane receptor protein involved in Fe transport
MTSTRKPLAALFALLGTQGIAQPSLEEVIVTAQKRSESVQDVSVTVSVMDGSRLREADIASLEEMSFYIPSYDQSRTVLGTEARIRGIGSASNPGFEQSVGTFIDDIYMSRSRQTVIPLFDLDRVEVLKGPQSILFGKNTIAGAVAMYTALPTEEPEGSLGALYGTDGQARGEAVWSGPLTDNLALRLAGMTRTSDGYIDNAFNGNDGPENDQWGLRGTLNWFATQDLTVRVKLEHSEDEVEGAPYVLDLNTQIPGPGAPPLFSHLDQVPPHYTDIDDGDAFETDVGNVVDGSEQLWDADTDFDNGLLHIEYQWGENLLTSITGYTGYDSNDSKDLDVSPVTLIGSDSREEYDQWSQELRLTSPTGDKFDYVTGLYVQTIDYKDGLNEVGFYTSNIGLPDISDGFRLYRFEQDTDTFSAFVMGNWHFTETLTLKLGLRYSWEEKDMDKSVQLTDAGKRPLVPGTEDDLVLDLVWRETQNAFPYETSQTRSEDHWSPQVILQWYPVEETMVYASASQGSKAGGWDAIHVNGDDLSTLEYEDESIDAFEVGIKATLWDQRATFNAAAFYSNIDDLQVSQFDGAVGFNVSNAAEATSQGIEMDARVAITERLTASAAVTWLDYSYDEYADAPCSQPQFNEHWLANGTRAGCSQDLKGEQTIQAPDWAGSASASYYWNPLPGFNLHLGVDVNYRDNLYLAADLDPNTRQGSVWLVNSQLALMPESGQWRVALIGKNLTDKTHYTFNDDAPLGNGNVYGLSDDTGSFVAITAPPRSFAVEATWYFK